MSAELEPETLARGIPPELRTAQPAVQSPARYAVWVAAAYLVFGVSWIVFSTWIAGSRARSVEQMEHFETSKGIGFIVVTAILFFGFAYALFVRIRRQEETIALQARAVENSERAILAGTFAGTIAHDINNALTVSNLAFAELRQTIAERGEQAQLADEVAASLDSILQWNRRLLDLGSRRATGTLTEVDLAALVTSSLGLVRRHTSLREREIHFDPPNQRIALRASEQLLRRAVLNLLLNAAEACAPGGRIEVAISADGDFARIRVDDDGPGIADELRRSVLQPFFTTKPEGTGIGLATVVACAEFHGGSVEIGRSELDGARFDLYLRR